MSTHHGLCSLVMWAAVALNGSFGGPRHVAAVEVTVSIGKVGFSWPQDAEVLYWRLQRLADSLCNYVDTIRFVYNIADGAHDFEPLSDCLGLLQRLAPEGAAQES